MIGIKLKFVFLQCSSRYSSCGTGRRTEESCCDSQERQTGLYLFQSAQTGSEVHAASFSDGTESPFSVRKATTYTAYDSSPSNSEFQNVWSYNPVLPYTSITCIAKTLTFPICLSHLNVYPATYLRKGLITLYTIIISLHYRPEFLKFKFYILLTFVM
jgi:hypothetical protein